MTRRIGMIIGGVAALLLLAILVGVVGLLYARPATAQTNVGVPGMRQVTVVGEGEVKGTPDTATVQIGVETEGATAKDALAANTTQAQALQAKLKELGVAEKDIKTSNFSVYPTYGADGRQISGYHVTNSVSVTVRDLGAAGSLLDQVVQAGANSINGVTFSVDDPKALLNQAREQAMQDAKAQAETLAKAGGAAVGDVLIISENIGSQPPMPLMMAAPAAADQSKAVPVQAGEQSFTVQVQVTFGLR
ncbi:MAG TPA: SIMPL domain-containing protein [Roseiflexaceae bacterium]|nr:SIMPL domain-containing protein [Roseiflexaceae bacterium]